MNQTNPSARPGSNARPATSGPARPETRRFTPEQISQARTQTWRALQLLGLVTSDGSPTCPVCHEPARGKFKVHADGGAKHHSRGCYLKPGPAIDLLMEHSRTGETSLSFHDAVAALIGAPLSTAAHSILGKVAMTDLPSAPAAFKSVVDLEIYDAVRTSRFASIEGAQKYYSEWHISPEATAEAGAVLITDVAALQRELVAQFGPARLVAAGLVLPPEEGPGKRNTPFWMLNERYSVIEPHLNLRGRTTGMQFRPVGATKAAVASHKTWKAAFTADPATAGTKVEYTTPFLSLRGAGTESLIGCGLYRLGALTEPTEVWVVEGFKDLLAARSMGLEAYAVPGVGARIPAPVLNLFRERGHTLVVCLDGDEAGERGRAAITASLSSQGVRCVSHPGLPEGMDVTDVLVHCYAEAGCTCGTCVRWRSKRPDLVGIAVPTGSDN
jgi:hypothetical protein